MTLRPFFSFYGSKWSIAPRYPTPKYGTIIEPFAGSAGYSLRYPDRMVKLIDLDPRVVGVWSYLIATPSSEVARLPLLEPGQSVDDLDICQEARWLIGFWLNKASTVPKKTASAWMRKERYRNQFWGERIRERVASQVDSIRHWEITHGSYADIHSQEATWFIDPPYQAKGRYYSCSLKSSCFPLLGRWCQSLPGQVIACEQAGADWLPFVHLVDAKATTKSAGAASTSKEVIWTSHSSLRMRRIEELWRETDLQIRRRSAPVIGSCSDADFPRVADAMMKTREAVKAYIDLLRELEEEKHHV